MFIVTGGHLLQTLDRLCDSPKTRAEDCLRLGLLFSIRYEKDTGDVERVRNRVAASKSLKDDQMAVSCMQWHAAQFVCVRLKYSFVYVHVWGVWEVYMGSVYL